MSRPEIIGATGIEGGAEIDPGSTSTDAPRPKRKPPGKEPGIDGSPYPAKQKAARARARKARRAERSAAWAAEAQRREAERVVAVAAQRAAEAASRRAEASARLDRARAQEEAKAMQARALKATREAEREARRIATAGAREGWKAATAALDALAAVYPSFVCGACGMTEHPAIFMPEVAAQVHAARSCALCLVKGGRL
jgi:hypothetical protein